MRDINNPTAAVIIAGITATVVVAFFGSPRTVAIIGSVGIAVAGVMRALYAAPSNRSDDDDPGADGSGDGGMIALLLVVSLFAGGGCAAAGSPRAEAEAAYTAEQSKCAATEPSRAAIDACRQRVRDEWAVKTKDGGR